MATHGTITEYALHYGCSQQAASQFKKAGRLVLDEVHGRLLVNFEASDSRIAATADPANVGRGANAPRGPRGTGAAVGRPIAPVDPATAQIALVYGRARAEGLVYRAKLRELDYRERCGTLIYAADARRAVFDAFQELRDAALRTPRRAAQLVAEAGASDLAEIERIFRAELEAAFKSFACSVLEADKVKEAAAS